MLLINETNIDESNIHNLHDTLRNEGKSSKVVRVPKYHDMTQKRRQGEQEAHKETDENRDKEYEKAGKG
jgi:hypothetical protein